ncbi:hypothetical protein BYT27DRAFT_7207910 [Phlegmacium glaucopus]|nr:hypothetical protein BYT27DRAFT_7207910 [Phlegmacium glaucopus]
MLSIQEEEGGEEEEEGREEGSEEEEACDVLAHHRKKTRSNQPPQLQRLSAAANRQAFHQRNHHAAQDSNAEESEGADDEVQDYAKTRAARNSNSSGNAKPDTLAFYKGSSWSSILVQAKIKYRRHIALHHGFPDRDEHLVDARKILFEVIAQFKDEGGVIDDTYQPVREMECLIFKEGASFRGKLKTVAHNAIERAFRDELDPPDEFQSQRDLQYVVEQNIGDLLAGGKFLMNGKDDAGRTNNLAHPCIRDICIKFFYTGKNALARTFPDDFRNSIPDHVIALVATTMRHCLQRYASGMFIESKFEGILQHSVHSRMLALIDLVKSDPYHRAKYDANRRQWAKLGMQQMHPEDEVERHNLEVILD